MNQLSRSTGLKIAAVLLWVIALFGMFAVGIPFLAAGMTASPESPPFWFNVLAFAVDAITIVVAYGVWRAERWGIILAIAISVYNVILNTMGALFDTRLEFQIMAGLFVFASLGVIYLCLRREPAQLAKSV